MEARVQNAGTERRETVRGPMSALLEVTPCRVRTSDDVQLSMMRRQPAGQTAGQTARLPAVVLLHGLCQTRHAWHLTDRSLSAYLASSGFDVFVPELRGHGRSRALTPDAEAQTYGDFSERDVPGIIQAALELSGNERVFLVGHGIGGTLGYAQASLQSQLAGLVQLAAPPLLSTGGRLLQAMAWVSQCLRRQPDSHTIVPPDLPAGAGLRLLVPYLDRPNNRFPLQLWEPRSIRRGALFERMRVGFERHSHRVAHQALYWMLRQELREWLSQENSPQASLERLSLPILAINGDHDHLVSASSVQSALERTHSRDTEFRQIGSDRHRHYGHFDLVLGDRAATDVWPLIRDWMQARS